jgi:hypothetical protein
MYDDPMQSGDRDRTEATISEWTARLGRGKGAIELDVSDTVLARPVGRPCSTCASSHRADIESSLLDGATISAISRQFEISRSAIRLHARAHVSEDTALRIQAAAGQSPTLIALRIHEVANRAREAAEDARDLGDLDAMLRAGNAETRALQVLVSAGVTNERLLEDLDLFKRLTGAFLALSRDHPKVRAAVAARLADRDENLLARAWLDEFDEVASS